VSGSIGGNVGDGVHLEGLGVRGNQIAGFFLGNSGSGVAILGGANSNVLSGAQCRSNSTHGILIAGSGTDANLVAGALVRGNGKSGIALLGGPGGGPRKTSFTLFPTSEANEDYGLLVSGVVDAPHATQISISARNNKKAGLRLERGTSGIDCSASVTENPIGGELDGTDVATNSVSVTAIQCGAVGISVKGARQNTLQLTAQLGSGTGVLFSGAKDNQVGSLTASANQGDGLVLTDSSEGNRFDPEVGRLSFRSNRNGVVIDGGSKDNVIREFDSATNSQHGILIQGIDTRGNQILNGTIGGAPFSPAQNGGDGVRIQGGATENLVGSDIPGHGSIVNNAGVGVRITGKGTDRNAVKGVTIGLLNTIPQAAGILVEDQAADTELGGPGKDEANLIAQEPRGIWVHGPVGPVVLRNNSVYSNFKTNAQIGILIDNAAGVVIGGTDAKSLNTPYFLPIGLQLQGAGTTNCHILGNRFTLNTNGIVILAGANHNLIGPGNMVDNSQTGMIVDGASDNQFFQNTIAANTGVGVQLMNGARDNKLGDNDIFSNEVGVVVIGPDTLRNTIRGNSIRANRQKGIVLADGGNGEIQPPHLNDVSTDGLFGGASAPDQSMVEIFEDAADEGDTLIDVTPLFSGKFRGTPEIEIADIGKKFQLNGTITDPQGNTSEFGPLRAGGIPPWKLSASPASLTAGPADGTVVTKIKLTPLAVNIDSVQLSLKGLPTGVTGTFSPNPVPGSTLTNVSLTLVVKSSLPAGSFPITISGVGTPSGYNGSSTASLTKSP
jgi:hypothetical protein